MNEMTPSACREEAARQIRLAYEAEVRSDFKQVARHIERARELTVLALKLEADSTPAVPVAE
jgi:hypothetical protein